MGDGLRSASSSAAAKLGHRYAMREMGDSKGYKRDGSLRQVRVMGVSSCSSKDIRYGSQVGFGESVISTWGN